MFSANQAEGLKFLCQIISLRSYTCVSTSHERVFAKPKMPSSLAVSFPGLGTLLNKNLMCVLLLYDHDSPLMQILPVQKKNMSLKDV